LYACLTAVLKPSCPPESASELAAVAQNSKAHRAGCLALAALGRSVVEVLEARGALAVGCCDLQPVPVPHDDSWFLTVPVCSATSSPWGWWVLVQTGIAPCPARLRPSTTYAAPIPTYRRALQPP
jgi:hypothetical protein